MSDATIVAEQLQDVVLSLGGVASAIRDIASVPPPTVSVGAPNVTVEASPVVVNVEAIMPSPTITIEAASAPNVSVSPQINLPPNKPVAYSVRVTERDANGFIAAFVITPA